MPHDIGNLVIAAVIHTLHRVEYTALDGFQAVLDMGDGTLENHIRGIVEEPALVHPRQMVDNGCIKTVSRLVVCRVCFFAHRWIRVGI